MDERIDIVTKDGKLTGKTALKSEIHKNGWFHNTIHLWLYTNKGEILLQQRSHKKKIFPLLWDVSAAGHIDAGETFIEAALRETKEEIGLYLSPEDLTKIGVFECFQSYNNGIIDNEFHNTYISELNVSLDNLTPQPEEVEALKLVTLDEFKTLLNASHSNGHFVPTNKPYYIKVLNAIIETLKKNN